MNNWIELLIMLLILSNFVMLGSSRISVCIRTVAIQGILLGILPLIIDWPEFPLRTAVLSAGAMILKGIIFPWLLFRAQRQAGIRLEVEPFVGYAPSLFIGLLSLVASLYIGSNLHFPVQGAVAEVIPLSLFSILAGLFLLTTRKNALSTVMGYLVLENGIYAFGSVVLKKVPAIVEMGVLLDALVAVFIMGIATYHINREFDHIDVDKLNNLKG
jgi:hydrogenase-4 component E